MGLFRADAVFFGKRLLRGAVHFLMLAALVMAVTGQPVAVLPMLFAADFFSGTVACDDKTGFVRIARSVCKKE